MRILAGCFALSLVVIAFNFPSESLSHKSFGEGDSPVLLRGLRKTGTVPGPYGTDSESRAQAPPTPSELERSPEGWKDLLAGAGDGLKGWTTSKLPSNPKAKAEATPSKPAGSQWRYDAAEKTIVCEGDGGHEWLRWNEELGDFVLHVEWRFIPVAGGKGYNSGIFVRNSADASIWHQAQTGDAAGGFLFGNTLVDGQASRVNLSRQLLDKRVKPAGEWNVCEVACRGKEISVWTNGATTCLFDACEVSRGFVGLEAEGWKIEFRNVKVKGIAAPATARWSFEADAVGGPAKGVTTGVGRWEVEERDGTKVLAQKAANDDPVFNVALVEGTSFQDVDVSVRVKADAGEFDQGGGVVWRTKDKDNYYVARYNPLENNLRMYLVENGRRTQLDHADAPSDKNWHTIRITAKGKQISGWLDGVRLLTATDRAFLGAGKIGVWSKADARSFFDDLTATEITP